MRRTPRVATAVLRGNNITAVPRMLALLCILSVFRREVYEKIGGFDERLRRNEDDSRSR